jgi:phytanoyl-CoA hydroxylase
MPSRHERLSAHFRHMGYLRVPEAIPSELVKRLLAVVREEFAAERGPCRRGTEGEIVRIDGVSRRDPAFIEALTTPDLLDALRILLGPRIVLLQNRHDHATLNRRGHIPVRLHRDVLQWSRPIITVLLFLEKSGPANGCTHVVPGSHVAPYLGMSPEGGGGNWVDDHEEYAHFPDQALPVPVPAGGALIMDGLLFHSVGHNATEDSRTSVTFALRSCDELSVNEGRHQVIVGSPLYRGNDLHHANSDHRTVSREGKGKV